MKILNRTLLALVAAIGVALAWDLLSRTGWASSVSVLGVAEGSDNALQPLLKIGGAILVMVSATQLVQNTSRFLSDRGPTRAASRVRQPAGRSSG